MVGQWFSKFSVSVRPFNLDYPQFIPSRDLFVTHDWPNQTQTALFECMAPGAGGVNFTLSFSQILLEN